MTDDIREAAAEAVRLSIITDDDGEADWGTFTNEDVADAVLAVVTPLIEAALIERLAERAAGSDTQTEILTDIVFGDSGRHLTVSDWLRAQKKYIGEGER